MKKLTRNEDSFNAETIKAWSRVSFFILWNVAMVDMGTAYTNDDGVKS